MLTHPPDDPRGTEPAPAPERIVADGRVLAYGMYRGPIADPNLQDLRLYGTRSARIAGLRLKQWQHLAIVHPEVLLTLAVVDAGWTRLGWVQVVDRRTGERVEHQRQAPWLDLRVARTLFDGHTWLRAGGLRVKLHADLRPAEGRHTVELSAPDLDAELECHATTTPLEVVLPLGRGRAMWSHKVPLPVSGTLRWGDRRWELDRTETTGLFDIHKAHYPHRTWWRWATFCGRDVEGRRVAVNLTRNVVTDPALHENALWLDGGLRLLRPATFDVSAEPWRMSGPDVDLRFDGQGERREDLSVGLLRSRFRQRYGTYSGIVAGRRIEGALGLAEDHHSRW